MKNKDWHRRIMFWIFVGKHNKKIVFLFSYDLSAFFLLENRKKINKVNDHNILL